MSIFCLQDKVVDPFVIYSDHGYATLRKIISEGVYEKQTEKLDEATKVWSIHVYFIY